jgi:hypothetical protein
MTTKAILKVIDMPASKETRSGYRQLTKAFKANATIKNYVTLRRAHPNEMIEVAVTGGYDSIVDNKKTHESFGIDQELLLGIADADCDAISELSLLLMERLISRKQILKAGKSHAVSRGEAISDPLVNRLIAFMLDSMEWNGELFLQRDLLVLIRHQLGMEAQIKAEKEREAREKYKTAATCAATKLAVAGKVPTFRSIAKEVGVDATTIMRWLPRDALDLLKQLASDLATNQNSRPQDS